MTIRQMRSRDLSQYGELCRYCFTSVLHAGPHQYMAWVGKHINHTWAAFEGDTMRAGMWYYPFEMRVADGYIPMGGVAAVATAPEARNRGHVKALMIKAHEQMRSEGRPLAVLMPFKGVFYARMGYADTFFQYNYDFTPHQLGSPGKTRAALREADGNKNVRRIEEYYQACHAGRLGTVKRSAEYWRARWFRTAQGVRKVYLVERADELTGFIIATLSPNGLSESPDLIINQAVWSDADALRAILGYVRAHRDQVRKVRWSVPVDVDLVPFFEDDDFKIELHPKMMLKLVDLKAAIERRQYPSDLTAEVQLDITGDDTSPWNSGRWAVTWDKGEASVKKARKSAQRVAKLTSGIQSFAVIYSGCRTAAALERDGWVSTTRDAAEALSRAFPPGTPFMQEWF